jgi:hypothetical protein|tara:strand:- start:412 stop:606 length:195 start_codon:yes stop_codon:yes gene_type:complete
MSDENKLTPTVKPTQFRLFCTEKWYEHKDEIFDWTGKADPGYDSTYYFRQHKWLLRSMFKESKK